MLKRLAIDHVFVDVCLRCDLHILLNFWRITNIMKHKRNIEVKETLRLIKDFISNNHVKCPSEIHINMRKSHMNSPWSNFYKIQPKSCSSFNIIKNNRNSFLNVDKLFGTLFFRVVFEFFLLIMTTGELTFTFHVWRERKVNRDARPPRLRMRVGDSYFVNKVKKSYSISRHIDFFGLLFFCFRLFFNFFTPLFILLVFCIFCCCCCCFWQFLNLFRSFSVCFYLCNLSCFIFLLFLLYLFSLSFFFL